MAPRGKYSILKQRVTIQLKTLHRFVIEEDVEAVKSIFVNLSSLYKYTLHCLYVLLNYESM
jgi:hypothetical protein